MTAVIVFLALFLLGFVFGKIAEKRHFDSLDLREKQTARLPLTTLKTVPTGLRQCQSQLVSGNVVISIDFYKKVLSMIKGFFGGRLGSYESLLARARREAILRMKETCIACGGKLVVNVRIETSSINKYSQNRSSVASVEVVAYGTAIIP